MLWIALGILVSYFLGSIPTAYIFGQVIKGVDIRKFGSGNVGATNAMRVLGKGPGISVLLLDMLKGVLAVLLAGGFVASRNNPAYSEYILLLCGLTSIVGHNWTIFLEFKGGKGIATTFGVLVALAIKIHGLNLILGLTIATWLIVFLVTRIVSLSSLLSGLGLPIYMVVFKRSAVLIVAGVILTIFIFLRHRSNLKRLFRGQEPRLF